MEWINVDDKMPESGTWILIHWEQDWQTGKLSRVSKGFYAAKHSIEDLDSDYSDYCEDKDQYFIPEGFKEDTWEGELYYSLSNVTHWMPLPAPPK